MKTQVHEFTQNSSPYSHSALYPPCTAKQVRSIFNKPERDTRITQEERSKTPPQVPAPSTTALPAKPDIILPPVCTHVPIKPKGLPPVLATKVAKPVHFTTDAEAKKAAQEAMHQRIHLLPNQQDLKDTIGKCAHKRKEVKNGLMQPSGPALAHPAACLVKEAEEKEKEGFVHIL